MAGRNHVYMSTQSQIDANRINASKSTGPSSSEGKFASAKNALIAGLYTTHDFVLPDEASLYKDFFDTMFQELSPAGLLENTLANQIAGAAWRLRRCDLADSDIASHTPLEPLLDTMNEKQIRSIERARAAAQSTLHRSLNQLRKIQTERIARSEIDWGKLGFPPLADTAKAQQALIAQYRLDKEMRNLQKDAQSLEAAQVDAAMQAIMNEPAPNWADIDITATSEKMASNCQTPQPQPNASHTSRPGLIPTEGPSERIANGRPKVGRNTPCPCGSGLKFKQCCLGKAA